MSPMHRWMLAGGVLGVLAGVALAAAIYLRIVAHPAFLAPSVRASHAQFMAPGMALVTPPGPGPFRTVLLIHGCGGLQGVNSPNPIMDEYARSAVEAGWAAAILDSYGPRHWGSSWARNRVCAGLRLPGFRRAADVLAGLDLLRADPRVDPRRLRVASWSHGGWAVGDLVTLPDPGDGSFRRTMAAVEPVITMVPRRGAGRTGQARKNQSGGGQKDLLVQHDHLLNRQDRSDPVHGA